MSLRLLSLLCLLLLSESSLAQKIPETCPVTKPDHSSFVPPYPYPADKFGFEARAHAVPRLKERQPEVVR